MVQTVVFARRGNSAALVILSASVAVLLTVVRRCSADPIDVDGGLP